MVFVDANVPMYLVGADHPNKPAAAALLERVATSGERLVTDAEVFQEILHRYTAINMLAAIQPAFDTLLRLSEEIFEIDYATVEAAKSLVQAYPGLSARDSIHISVMQRMGISQVISFDAGFDLVPGLRRLQLD